jgi:hypothetical protein
MPSTSHALAASDIGEYYATLSQLDVQQLLDPLVLLEGTSGVPSSLRPLRLPSFRINKLFMERDPQPLTPPQSSPEISPIGVERLERMSLSDGLPSPHSPAVSTTVSCASSLSGIPRLIDPTKVRGVLRPRVHSSLT